jgi:hypothetical protein
LLVEYDGRSWGGFHGSKEQLMASNALQDHLEAVLIDAEELVAAHANLCTGKRGRQYGLGAINRAIVVMCAAAWEAYVEEIVREAINSLIPPTGSARTAWPALNANALNELKRFNTPNSQNVRNLLSKTLALPDVTTSWYWQNCSTQKAVSYLDNFLQIRHETAHGVNPRPVVHNNYTSWLPSFVRNLARRTDASIASHLASLHGIARPW